MGLVLRDIDFGGVSVSSGTLNFFGEGWPYHKVYKMIPGFDFTGATFTAKTTTVLPRPGNMPLKDNFQPIHLLPACIKVNFFKAIALNAVGLSGPGLHSLLKTQRWHNRPWKPFWLSFMAVEDSKAKRLEEMRLFVSILKKELPHFLAEVGLQINLSCPNTEHDPKDLISEAIELLGIAKELNIPLDIKVNVLVDLGVIKELDQCEFCDVITCSNTIPWGALPERIDWFRLFGKEKSPLANFGGGGLSGAPLLPIVADSIKKFRDAGVTTPIKACGGILHPKDVVVMKKAGAKAIEIGTVSIVRPWNVKGIIKKAQEIF